MPLDLWFRDDVSRILAATHESFRASATFRPTTASPDPSAVQAALAYQQGCADTLRAIALAFGLATPGCGPVTPPSFAALQDRPAAALPRLALAHGPLAYPFPEADLP